MSFHSSPKRVLHSMRLQNVTLPSIPISYSVPHDKERNGDQKGATLWHCMMRLRPPKPRSMRLFHSETTMYIYRTSLYEKQCAPSVILGLTASTQLAGQASYVLLSILFFRILFLTTIHYTDPAFQLLHHPRRKCLRTNCDAFEGFP